MSQSQPRLLEGRFPDYDVLSKRLSPSWNDKTREVITHRLAVGGEPKFFTADEFQTVQALAARIVPQPASAAADTGAALVDEKLHQNKEDGYRPAGMPREAEAWRRGLKALDEEAKRAFGVPLPRAARSTTKMLCLTRMQKGELKDARLGRYGFGRRFSRCAWHATSFLPTTPIRRPGAKSAGAARRVLAAMCAWTSTSVIPGRRPKSRMATSKRRAGKIAVSDPFADPARHERPGTRRLPSRRLGADA